jgi:hypothetical protein
MSAIASLHRGVEAIKAGQLDEGARLLREALRDDSIQGELRATALTWLADTVREAAGKIELYEQALAADAGYTLAQRRMAQLLQPDSGNRQTPAAPPTLPETAPPPPPPPVYQSPKNRQPQTIPNQPTTFPAFPSAPQQTGPLYRVVAVKAEQRRGSGFFIDQNGLVATTRHVVGAQENVTLELEPGKSLEARVVRSFPEMDVALVHVDYPVGDLLPFSPADSLPENTPITVMAYQRPPVQGHRRETGRAMAAHLFPTDISQIPDSGGAPVFDDRQILVGMITRNISSSSAYVYGVHLAAIRHCVDIFRREMQANGNRVYCANCGATSAAAASGGYYCETCGAVMPFAQNRERHPSPQINALYSESDPVACASCGARAGFYQGRCLRCGQAGNMAQAARY